MMKSVCDLHKVAMVLVVVGGLNWGLIGFFDWNLVKVLLGSWPWVERVVYDLVGLSAVLMLFCGMCKKCHMGGGMGKSA